MIKGLVVLGFCILVLILFPKLIKIFRINNEKEIKDSLGEIAYKEANELTKHLNLTDKYKKLANSIIRSAEEKLDVNISKFNTTNNGVNNKNNITNNARTVLTDDNNHPFQINEELALLTEKIITNAKSSNDKLLKIYNWFIENIDYGTNRRASNNGYRTSNEVFDDKEGICGEMASLFVVMSRYAGFKSNYVSVRKDMYGDEVYHACIGVSLDNLIILIDPAYKKFKADHKDYIIRTDVDAITHLKSWRDM